MRFEKDHDPDPLRDKYQKFEGIANLPESVKKKVDASYKKITKSASEYEDTFPDLHGLVAYMAVQDVQITALQKEIRTILKSILSLAIKLDSMSDGDS